MRFSTANKRKANKNGRLQSLRRAVKSNNLQRSQQGFLYGFTCAPKLETPELTYTDLKDTVTALSLLFGKVKPQGEGKKREWTFDSSSTGATEYYITPPTMSISFSSKMTNEQATFWKQALGLPANTEEDELISAVEQQLQAWEESE